MNNEYIRRNVTIQGHRTSMSLENAIWSALEEICERENMTFNQLCSLVDRNRDGSSRTSAVRTFLVNYYRLVNSRCTEDDCCGNIGVSLENVANGPALN